MKYIFTSAGHSIDGTGLGAFRKLGRSFVTRAIVSRLGPLRASSERFSCTVVDRISTNNNSSVIINYSLLKSIIYSNKNVIHSIHTSIIHFKQ